MNQYLFELHLYDECDSTNTQAWNFFDKNALDGAHLFIAKKQTAGRGRQGRQWNSKLRGNLYCSMLFKPNQEMVPFLSLAAGLSAARILSPFFYNENDFHLKWPNDLLWDSKKMGGILCESRFQGNQCSAVVIGWGLNVAAAPEDAECLKSVMKPELSYLLEKEDFIIKLARDWAFNIINIQNHFSEHGAIVSVIHPWSQFAKIERFNQYQTHNEKGEKIQITARGLNAEGKMICIDQTTGKTLTLDQPF